MGKRTNEDYEEEDEEEDEEEENEPSIKDVADTTKSVFSALNEAKKFFNPNPVWQETSEKERAILAESAEQLRRDIDSKRKKEKELQSKEKRDLKIKIIQIVVPTIIGIIGLIIAYYKLNP